VEQTDSPIFSEYNVETSRQAGRQLITEHPAYSDEWKRHDPISFQETINFNFLNCHTAEMGMNDFFYYSVHSYTRICGDASQL